MSLTLNTKVFSFAGWLSNGIGRFLNKESDTAAGFLTATAKVDEPGNTETYKVRWKLKLPTVVDASDASCLCPDGIIRESFADIVVTVHKGAGVVERTGLAVSVKDLTASPEFQASVISLMAPSS